MQTDKFEVVGQFLAVRWRDGSESFVELERLRRACPCAQCSGEVDLTGQIRSVGAASPLSAQSFELVELQTVGHYAIQPRWADGHETGIFTHERLRALADPKISGAGGADAPGDGPGDASG